jgi:anti-sigma regulatory factor (Ser/Thr protein kinase)
MTDIDTVPGEGGFVHEAVLYADDDEFLDGTLQFLRDGFEAGEPILVAVNRPKIRALRGELHGEGERLSFADIEVLGRNPACIIPAWARFVDEHRSTAARVRGVGEPAWPGRTAAELDECDLHERLLNLAFDSCAFWLRCPYDAARLPDSVTARVHEAHDIVVRDRVSELVELDHDRLVAPFAQPLDEPPLTAACVQFNDDRGIAQLRECVASRARELGSSEERTADIVLAVHEIATNSLRYGHGSGTARLWVDDGSLVCEIRDAGHITDPLTGRRAPRADAIGGRGVWITNHLADLVQLRSSADGTTVRVYSSPTRSDR